MKTFLVALTIKRSFFFFQLPAAAAAAKSLQLCPTLCDPIDGSPPGFLSLGFSRQEHWSGLPFPSPMQEREKGKWNLSVVLDSSWPHGLQPTRLLHPWDFPGKSTGVGCHCLLHPASYNSLIYFICLTFSRLGFLRCAIHSLVNLKHCFIFLQIFKNTM